MQRMTIGRPADKLGARPFAFQALVVCMMLASFWSWSAPAQAREDFKTFLENLWPEARDKYGVSRQTFDKVVKSLKPDLSLPDLEIPGRQKTQVRQSEFTSEPSDYIDAAYLARLANTGQRLASEHKAALDRIEQEFGVDRYSVLAIFGRETAFGAYTPKYDAITVLATQAWTGRRKEMFRDEFLYALKLLEKGVPRNKMRASWAGAMGLTQFMPSEFFAHVHDMGGDGYADLFDSVPDALASAARQLKNKGWQRGQTWGYEVAIPETSDCSLEGPPGLRPLREWVALGYRRTGGREFPDAMLNENAYLMSPAGAHGPSFLALENFQVIRRYNTSDLYATFVGNLADRIAGGGDFHTRWEAIGPQRTALIRGIQQGLKDRGYGIETVDGFIGSNTRRQVGRYQKDNGLRVDCWPSDAVLNHLQKTSG
ncbi:Lytic murein transglycosylase [Candidatus Filomicrobium marinum]|uniref:Lytic murein transglycosylase n=2 Tax=Candidatus Filomicrobium marinum TaxID=1608628 RepID=A0A0D6JGV1_9HYPH|nr:Lytic murein transglycosylase [Candidatus Filomicrobium marinum]CPR19771.1 Lytic murein transglycosylase [Candidatus Filomicrobium marinum]